MAAGTGSKPKSGFRSALWAGLAALIVLFGGLGLWAGSAVLSGAVIASGSVVVKGQAKTIQHLDGGVVEQILVDNGDVVEVSDVLIRLDRTLLETNLAIYESRLVEFFARKARLTAERDGALEIEWNDPVFDRIGIAADLQIRLGQSNLFRARRETNDGQIRQLREKISQFQRQIEGAEALRQSKAVQVELLDRELVGVKQLRGGGHVPITRVLALERARADLLGQLSEHEAEFARLKNAISEVEIQILQVTREFRQSVLTELEEINQGAREMIQQHYATSEQLKRIEIRAPVSGMVHELAIFTIGGVVAPGGAVMQIVPQDGAVDLEVNLETQFRDEVFVGQNAHVRLPAFNQSVTPELDGVVRAVSPSSVVDEDTGAAFYKVSIELPKDQIDRLDGVVLVPGMPVEAFMQTGDRTLFSYITKPLVDQVARAFREE